MNEVILTVTQGGLEATGPGNVSLVLRTTEISKVSIPLSLENIQVLEGNLKDAKLLLLPATRA